AVGSGLGFLAGGFIGKAAKLPTLLSTMLLSISQAAEEYNTALQITGDEDKAYKTFIGNLPFAATEVLPFERLFSRLDKLGGRSGKQLIIDMFTQGTIEGAQEVIQQFGANLNTKMIYDSSKSLSEGTLDGGLAGFVTGMLMTGIGNAATNKLNDGNLSEKEITELTEAIKNVNLAKSKVENIFKQEFENLPVEGVTQEKLPTELAKEKLTVDPTQVNQETGFTDFKFEDQQTPTEELSTNGQEKGRETLLDQNLTEGNKVEVVQTSTDVKADEKTSLDKDQFSQLEKMVEESGKTKVSPENKKNILDTRFSHRQWFADRKLTKREALDEFAKSPDFYLDKKPAKKQSDNLLDDWIYDETLNYSGSKQTYKLSPEEKTYFLERQKYYQEQRKLQKEDELKQPLNAEEEFNKSLRTSSYYDKGKADEQLNYWKNIDKDNEVDKIKYWETQSKLREENQKIAKKIFDAEKNNIKTKKDYQDFESKVKKAFEDRYGISAKDLAAGNITELIGKDFNEPQTISEQTTKPTKEVTNKVSEEGVKDKVEKQPYEMTQEEFSKQPNITIFMSEAYRPEDKMTLANMYKNKIYRGKKGELHANIIDRTKTPYDKTITGFLDKDGNFIYQNPDYSHKLLVEQAIQEGKIKSHPDYPELTAKEEKPKKVSAKDEFKVGDVIETSEGLKQTIREVKGNSIFFTDENGVDYSGFARSTLRELVNGGSWKRVEKPVSTIDKLKQEAKQEVSLDNKLQEIKKEFNLSIEEVNNLKSDANRLIGMEKMKPQDFINNVKKSLAEKEQKKDNNKSSALRMFGEGKKDTEVVTALGLKGKAGMDQVREWRKEFEKQKQQTRKTKKVYEIPNTSIKYTNQYEGQGYFIPTEYNSKQYYIDVHYREGWKGGEDYTLRNDKGEVISSSISGKTDRTTKMNVSELVQKSNEILENQVKPLKPEPESKVIPETKKIEKVQDKAEEIVEEAVDAIKGEIEVLGYNEVKPNLKKQKQLLLDRLDKQIEIAKKKPASDEYIFNQKQIAD
ncbi:MAG: hypothetical protein ACP5N7_07140, partial [Candidatus Pacearchaeota archaeon]